MQASEATRTKAGIIPFRRREGHLEVLLVTTRSEDAWIIPKGWIEQTLGTRETARREAYTEAGVKGRLLVGSLGCYLQGDAPGQAEVEVFLMEVQRELARWPERHVRRRRWMTLHEARAAVAHRGLAHLLDIAEEILA